MNVSLFSKNKSNVITPFDQHQVKKEGYGFFHRGNKYIHHTNLPYQESAFFRLNYEQKIILGFLILIINIAFYLNWSITALIIISELTLLYFIDLIFNFWLIIRGLAKTPEIKISRSEIKQLSDSQLPTYTIFCPLYKEWQVLPQFISAINKITYPASKLQVMLLLEEDDKESIERINTLTLPNNFSVIMVPNSKPKTKPKACNYGLQFAKGEYCVIYDAEDIPDPDQLKKAYLAFQKAGDRVGCIQAKLNFYNPNQNILTKVFTAEYSLWFDLILTGLQSINAPIPLGGTSNHFKTANLKQINGWDSFNVTEDCDLGVRLFKNGFKTAIVDSTTHEEANSKLSNWFWQRTRWNKGYIQTYLVHMRDPFSFSKNRNDLHILTFQLIVGGRVFAMLVNPFMWALTIAYFLFRSHIGHSIEYFFPTPVLYMGVFSTIFGNFLYLYYYMIGCAKRGFYDLIKYVYFVPLYWLAMSLAAWVSIYKMIVQPHYWFKTKHGLHLEHKSYINQAFGALGNPALDSPVGNQWLND